MATETRIEYRITIARKESDYVGGWFTESVFYPTMTNAQMIRVHDLIVDALARNKSGVFDDDKEKSGG